jgi:hypothetical protein
MNLCLVLKPEHFDFSGAVAPPVRPTTAAPVFTSSSGVHVLVWEEGRLGCEHEEEEEGVCASVPTCAFLTNS